MPIPTLSSSSSARSIPTWPQVTVSLDATGRGEVATSGGSTVPVTGQDLPDGRSASLHIVRSVAAGLDRPVRVHTCDPDGEFHLIVDPDPAVPVRPDENPPARLTRRPGTPAATVPTPGVADTGQTAGAPPQPTVADHRPAPPARANTAHTFAAGSAMITPAEDDLAAAHDRMASWAPVPGLPELPGLRELRATRPQRRGGGAERGWQSQIRRATGGRIAPAPGAAELAYRSAVRSVQRSVTGPRVIVVANPKGGAPKTTTVLGLASTFGRHRGGSVLAWDNNENRGTLGLRAMANPQQTNTAVDLLRDLERFTGPAARAGDLDNFVRAQGDQHFDVLASSEDPTHRDAVGAGEFDALHAVLQRFYRLLIIDTGNSSAAPNWRAAVATADQLVVPVSLDETSMDHAAGMLDDLLDAGRVELVRNAVTVVVAIDGDPRTQARRAREHFGRVTRAVVHVPADPALAGGREIDYERLTPASQDAWLQAGAAVAAGL